MAKFGDELDYEWLYVDNHVAMHGCDFDQSYSTSLIGIIQEVTVYCFVWKTPLCLFVTIIIGV